MVADPPLFAVDLVERHLALAREAARETARPDSTPDARLFVYWAQGFESAPPLVQACRRQVLRMHDPARIVFLDDASLPEWVDVPDWLSQKLAANKTAYSDVVRVALLARHGGMWLDATCFPRMDLLNSYDKWTRSGFFARQKLGEKGRISSWILASRPAHRTMRMMDSLLLQLWREVDRPPNYFYFHQIFYALYRLDDGVRASFDGMPVLGNRNPRLLQHRLHRSIGDAKVRKIYLDFKLHKLSYKRVGARERAPGTFYSGLIEDALPA